MSRQACAVQLALLLCAPLGGYAQSAPPSPDPSSPASSSPATWAERLGYPASKRVLILHADDAGMCYEANAAAKRYLTGSHIQSAAVMVPCPWFDEFAAWYREHPEHDVGLHLTLTSEWKHYRWGPVAPRAKVPRLLDKDGYLPRSVFAVASKAPASQVEIEIRAQIERALARGIRPGHLDTHMGTLYSRPDYIEVYTRLAVEYGIPAMVVELTPANVERFRAQGYPISDAVVAAAAEYPLPKLDGFHSVRGGKTYDEILTGFFTLVSALPPGIHEIIFHPADESETLRRITGSWRQRVAEGRMFADERVVSFLKKEGVLFTNWKEMMRRHRKKSAK